MAVGGFYIDASGLEELVRELNDTAGGMRDLSKVYRKIGRRAEWHVKTHWPVYPGSSKDGAGHGFLVLQMNTTGGGGKTAWVKANDAGKGHLILTEFGGTSVWHRYGAGVLGKLNRGHRSLENVQMTGGSRGKSHVVYKKPRKPRGYALWNVAYYLRSEIGGDLTSGIKEISEKHGLLMDVADRGLDIEQNAWGGQS